MAAVFRAIFGYLFPILMVWVVGRRPGKQITPFEFTLIFFLGQPAIVSFSLEPASPGIHHWKIGVPGGETIEKRVVVVP